LVFWISSCHSTGKLVWNFTNAPNKPKRPPAVQPGGRCILRDMTRRNPGREHQVSPKEEAVDLTRLGRILEEFKGVKGALIPILQRAQDAYGYLPRPALEHIAKVTRLPLSDVYGVATFYAQFHLERRGKHLIRVCDGTACHVRGAPKNIAELEKVLGLAPGTTSPDFEYTIEVVYCLGSCGLAPVAVVDNHVCGRLGAGGLVRHLEAIAK
jgi:NADH-quinone oxidoreductase subunit E